MRSSTASGRSSCANASATGTTRPHEANLFDINAKYGDVVSKAEAIKYLNALP